MKYKPSKMGSSKPFPDAPTSNAVAAKFSAYRTTVMPPTAPPIQVRECELAFYGGCEAMFDIITTMAPEDEEAAMVFMASLKNEIWERARKYVETLK